MRKKKFLKRRSQDSLQASIPEKANRLLNGILVVLILVVIKIWHLAVVQHDEKVEEARKPQRRYVSQRADRATICDRSGVPLALNQVKYRASIVYEEIREIPRWIWKRNEDGKKFKYFARKEYIQKLSQLLSKELDLDALEIEDLIHAKAAVLGNAPFLIKDNISEETYFRLNMLEKDWPGIHAETAVHRYYPLGPVGCEVVGYLGAINKKEYDSLTCELRRLRTLLEDGEDLEMPVEEIQKQIKDLERKAYTISDLIGKVGIEAACDSRLRGLHGKKIYLADTRGRFLSELPGGEDSRPGNRVQLALSAELQEYGEKLLADFEQNHKLRNQDQFPEKQPWIKGGAIVAMDPNTGEILALSAFPRFNPNDFISSNFQIHRWLEDECYLAAVWDQKCDLEREKLDEFRNFYTDSLILTWPTFLQMILPPSSPVRKTLDMLPTVGDAVFLQEKMKALQALFQQDDIRCINVAKVLDFVYCEDEVATGVMITLKDREYLSTQYHAHEVDVEKLKKEMQPYFQYLPLNCEKLLLLDLYRLVVNAELMSPAYWELFGKQTLSEYRQAAAHLVSVKERVREIASKEFDHTDFKEWRESEFKTLLAAKRKEEKETKKYARPYTDYLEEKRKELFQKFWDANQWEFVTIYLTGIQHVFHAKQEHYSQLFLNQYMELSKQKAQLSRELEHYYSLQAIVQEIATPCILPYLKALRGYWDLNRPLLGRYPGLRSGKQGMQLEKHLATAFYPTFGFGYARSQAFRQAAIIGSLFKLVPAYEALKQSLDKGNSGHLNPLIIIDDKQRLKNGSWNVGYTNNGRPIPMFYKNGRIPRSEHAGIGRVDLIQALGASSNPYFSLLAGEYLEDAEDLSKAASLFGFGEKTGIDLPGEYAGKLPDDVTYNRTGLYAFAIGQHTLVGTPLQTAVMLSAIVNGGKILKPQIIHDEGVKWPESRWQIYLPQEVRQHLITGMRQVIFSEKGTARLLLSQFPQSIVQQIIGKTSTAEINERVSLDGVSGCQKFKHIGFGAISFHPQDAGTYTKPELVVVVYLRFGEWGKEAAPLGVKMIQKWREIQAHPH